MRKQFVINLWFHVLLVFRVTYEHGFSVGFAIYPYRNVLALSSGKNRSCIFCDYERPLTDYRLRKIRKVMNKENIFFTCIFQSSKGKYHFIIPQLYDWLEALRISKDLGSEKNYLSISSVRQEFILRITKKGSKDEPRLIKTLINRKARKILFSSSMLKFLRFYYNVNFYYNEDMKVINPLIHKDKLIVEKYRTTNL